MSKTPKPDPQDPYSRDATSYQQPPRGFWPTVRQLGPGMILAGSIVGSGELIMTTKLGAVAGFLFLWFVLLSCFIKVVVQAEIARHTISSGRTFLDVFNSLPGPSVPRPRWLTLTWLAVVLVVSAGALIGFVNLPDSSRGVLAAWMFGSGAVALIALAAWFIARRSRQDDRSADGRRPQVGWFTWLWLVIMLLSFVNSGAILGGAGQALEMLFPDALGAGGSRIWGIIVAASAAVLLLSGGYSSLEKLFITLVATFTLLTLISTFLLQRTGFAVSWEDVQSGLTFNWPPMTTAITLTALAMYAGTGVAYGEMWNYTYWCVEKGYARNAGDPKSGGDWPTRARGWVRVMYIDVIFTMFVYTISTICFYLLGAAVLHRQGLDPTGEKLSTLSATYTDSLGSWSATLFVVGAFFVLITTVLASVAGTSRLMADALGVIGIINSRDYPARLRFIRIFIVLSLAMFSITYWLFEDPPQMLLITSSIIAAVMYPILGLGALYLRHRKVDERIRPGAVTTSWLWICALALAVISPGGILISLALKNGWFGWG